MQAYFYDFLRKLKFPKLFDCGTVGGVCREECTVDEFEEAYTPWGDDEVLEIEDSDALNEKYVESMWTEIDDLEAFNTFTPRSRADCYEYKKLSATWV